MDVRGLTLRSKSKSSRRPQISAPRPIADPSAGPPPAFPSSLRAAAAAGEGSSAFPPLPSSSSTSSSRPQQRQQQQQQANGGATSDLVKRRYSTRYNQLPNFDVNAPPVPTVPSLPKEFLDQIAGLSTGGGGGPGTSQPIKLDVKALRDPTLPVESYVTSLLANASEQDIQEFQDGLRKLKNRTSTDLQQNVYQNRTQFIKISQEAEKLKEEMSTLRGLMSELTAALGQASATNAAGGGPGGPGLDEMPPSRRNPNRSSVANLETMWNLQLQTLWKTVERSQKFLPAIPGRHIVLESGQWVELDSATWKPRRPVHIVLLNDHLLVAAKKRKRIDANSSGAKASAPTKLVAEECWALQDIDLIDLGAAEIIDGTLEDTDDPAIPNAINIRFGARSFTYRSDQRNSKAKMDLVMTFRRTVEELRKFLRTEAELSSSTASAGGAVTSAGGGGGGGGGVGGNTANGSGLTSSASSRRRSEYLDALYPREKLDILIDVDGKQQNMRWVEGQVDELDMDIALQHFESAVARVERLRRLTKSVKSNLTAQELICTKVNQRAGMLAETLLRSLVDTHSFLRATKSNIAWLARLGFGDQAREAYLHARTEVITKRSRQCLFEGDLPLYIFQISFVFFTLIRNTINTFQQCFPSPMSSACIKWAKEHLDSFNAVLSRQLSSVDSSSEVWQKCMEVVHDHANLLADVGVDFGDMIQLDNGGEK